MTTMTKENAKENSMRKITLYRDDSTTQVVFENVKHWFWTAGNTVLTIAQFTDVATGAHKYVNWPRERLCWFKDEKRAIDFRDCTRTVRNRAGGSSLK